MCDHMINNVDFHAEKGIDKHNVQYSARLWSIGSESDAFIPTFSNINFQVLTVQDLLIIFFVSKHDYVVSIFSTSGFVVLPSNCVLLAVII